MKDRYIPLDKCVDGNLYRIHARNGRFGVFVKGEGKKHEAGNDAFKLSRHKFGSNFIEHEFHWDTGEPYGTVMPLEDIGPAPDFRDEKEMLRYLNELTEAQIEKEKREGIDYTEEYRKRMRDELQQMGQ